MNRRRQLIAIPALLLATVAIASCGDDKEQEPADTDVTETTEMMTDSTEMMTDSTEMMTDTTEMMTDTTEMMTDTTGG